jgi:NAD(P)-dependent dehydrogenase (short-subunit alcohol dehydrogenase family)
VARIAKAAAGGLVGLVTSAGANVTDNVLVTQLNYFGTVELIEGAKGLRQKVGGSVVLVSSTAAPMNTTPDFVDALLAGDSSRAVDTATAMAGSDVYIGTKRAITHWMRRHVVEYASVSVRMNAIAPG